MLYNENPQLFPKGLDISASDIRMLDQPKLHITYLDHDEVHLKSPAGIGNKFCLISNLPLFCNLTFHHLLSFEYLHDVLINVLTIEFMFTDLKSLEKEIVRSRSMLSGKNSSDMSKPDCFLKMVTSVNKKKKKKKKKKLL